MTGTKAVVLDPAGLHRYEPDWRRLAERRGNAFITPEWFLTWLEHYRETAEPLVPAALADDGSLRGLLPLVVEHGRRPRAIRFGGAAMADHLQPVCLPEDEETVAASVAEILAEEAKRRRWGLMVLDNVEAGAGWWRKLAVRPPFIGLDTYRQTALPGIELPTGGWDDYLASRSRNFRDQAGRYPRRLEREHHVSYRRTTEQSELARDMETLFALHDARWTSRGGSNLASERARAFHLDFAAAALARGWLRLWVLEVDGTPVAAWYGWRIGDTYAYYQAGFDPSWDKLSVGFVLLVHTVRSAIEEGALRYDMLLGEESYKDRFVNSERTVCTAMLSSSRSARLLSATETWTWKASRSLSPGIRSRAAAIAAVLPGARRR